jgi:hypothetical protein
VAVLASIVSLLVSVSPAAPEASFWQWFAANAAHVATIRHGDEPIADELAAQLKKVDPDLTYTKSVVSLYDDDDSPPPKTR